MSSLSRSYRSLFLRPSADFHLVVQLDLIHQQPGKALRLAVDVGILGREVGKRIGRRSRRGCCRRCDHRLGCEPLRPAVRPTTGGGGNRNRELAATCFGRVCRKRIRMEPEQPAPAAARFQFSRLAPRRLSSFCACLRSEATSSHALVARTSNSRAAVSIFPPGSIPASA